MDIEISTQGAVRQIKINRPGKRNALTAAMYHAIADALERADYDPRVNVILICGTNGVFSTGNDLGDLREALAQDDWSSYVRLYRTLCGTEKPVLAGVEGMAIGVATALLLHCDLVYAAGDAVFALPCAHFGLLPEAGCSLLLPRLVGHQRAAEKLLLGEPFTAYEAAEFGMVNRVLPQAELASFAQAQAQKLAGLPPGALRLTKALMKAGERDTTLARIDEELRVFRASRNRAPTGRDSALEAGRVVTTGPWTGVIRQRKPVLHRPAHTRRSRWRAKN